MSQFFVVSQGGGGDLPPDVPTSFITDDGTAVPSDNELNILTDQTFDNNDDGIDSVGSGNTVTIRNTNRVTAQVQTTTDDQTNLLFFNLGGDPATYFIEANVVAHNETSSLGASYGFKGCMRTDGTDAFEIANETTGEFAEGIMATAEITMTTTGNDVAIFVTPVDLSGQTINWNTLLTFRTVGEA